MAKQKLAPFYLRLRFTTALIATWIMNLGMFGSRFTMKSACAPGFNCHGCPWATFACPVGVISFSSAMHALPVFAIGSVLAIGAVIGRLVCGFACPFGFLQDLMHRIPSPKFRLPRWSRYGKYAALLLLVLVLPYVLGFVPSGFLKIAKPVPDLDDEGKLDVKVQMTNLGTEPVRDPQLMVVFRELDTKAEVYREERQFAGITVGPGETLDLPAFKAPNMLSRANLVVDSPQSEIRQSVPGHLYYCDLCPNGTLTATIPAMFADGGQSAYERLSGRWLRLSILGGFLVLMVIASRPVCRLFCPLGAMYALTTPYAMFGMAIDKGRCAECGKCDKVCPMELDVRREVGGSECIACGDCKKACPTSGIRRTFALAPAGKPGSLPPGRPSVAARAGS